jgi:hypothetical protein
MKDYLSAVVEFVAILLLTLVTGVFWGTWFTLTRSIENFSPSEFIHIGQTIIGNVAVPMRIIMPTCILFLILSTWFSRRNNSAALIVKVAACILIIITLLITLLILVPIDNQIRLWTAATIPSEWGSIRDRWQFFHSMRTLSSLASFCSFAAAIIFQNKRKGV